MKNKLTIGFLFSLMITFSALQAVGQDYAFKVLVNKGNNEVKSGGDTWTPIKTGVSLKSSDELKIADNAYIGLIHATGKPIELRESGNYKVSDLTEKVKAGSSVVNKYTDFILSSNAENKKNRLSATGAVHRATETAAIHVMLPENANSDIFNSKAVINWDGKVQGPYIVVIKDLMEDQLDSFETPETTITIDMAKYQNQPAVMIEVSSKSDPRQISRQCSIKKISPANQEKIKKLMAELGDMSEENALNKFYLAMFYEENKLLIDAIAAFEEVIKLAPDVPEYREAYDEFLLRHGLKK